MQATPRLGLHLPEGTDQFQRQMFLDNFDWLDDNPGLYVCTSTTHPTTWGDNQVGRCIIEADTGSILRFNESHVFESVFATDPQSAVNAAQIAALNTSLAALTTQVNKTPDTFVAGQNVNNVLAQGQSHSYTFANFANFKSGVFFFWTVCDFVLPTPVGTDKQVIVTTELLVDGVGAYFTGNPYIEEGSYTGTGLAAHGNTRRQVVGIGYRNMAAAGSHSLVVKVDVTGGANASCTVDHVRVFGILGAG